VAPVYIIDDDKDVRLSLVMLCRAMGIEVRPFRAGQDFLDELPFLEAGAILVDLRMPDISGLELLAALRRQDCFWPAAVITGHGDVAAAVQAMKLGAIDFLEKPFTDTDFEAVVEECSRRVPAAVQLSHRARTRRRMLQRLTPREREVFEGVAAGETSKQIAARLALSPRTVESYRQTMMAKLGAQRLHDLLAFAHEDERVAK
jgi:two-component system response regulator FixJ